MKTTLSACTMSGALQSRTNVASRVFAALLLGTFLLLCASVRAQPVTFTVNVYHAGSDSIGQQLAFSVREALRASQGFRLASADDAQFQIRILTQDPDKNEQSGGGDRTMAAITYLMNNTLPYRKDNPMTWHSMLITTSITMTGRRRIDDTARNILATLDNALEEHRAHLHRR